jgi:hypothetical protein
MGEDLAGAREAAVTLLSVVVATADSTGAALVQHSWGRGNFLAFLVAGDRGRFGDRGFRGRELFVSLLALRGVLKGRVFLGVLPF